MSEALSRVGELALVICLIYGLALIPSFAWWNDSFEFQRTLSISNSVSEDNVVVFQLINFSSGAYPLNTSLRLVASDDVTEIPINIGDWVYNGTGMTYANITFVDNFTAGVNNTYKLYYSSVNLFPKSTPAELLVADDFNSTTLNTTIWADLGGCTEYFGNGILTVFGGSTGNNNCIDAHKFVNTTYNLMIVRAKQVVTTTDNQLRVSVADWASAADMYSYNQTSLLYRYGENSVIGGSVNKVSGYYPNLTQLPLNTFVTTAVKWNSSGVTWWVDLNNDGTFVWKNFTTTPTPQASKASVMINVYKNTINFSIDYVMLWNSVVTPALGNLTSYLGSETGIHATVTSLGYAVANRTLAYFNLSSEIGTISDIYWDFGDGIIEYSSDTNVTHNYTTAGYFTVNANFTISTTNYTAAPLNMTVYSPLASVSVTPSSYVPFAAVSPIVNLTYVTAGGTPYQNATWTFSLSNGTVETATTHNTTYYQKTAQPGIYSVSLRVCDVVFPICATNTTRFNMWNVTGGVFAVNSFNKTSNLLAEVFEGDNLTFQSTTSLNWNLSGYSVTGTSVNLVFNSSYDFFEDQNYLHFNVSVMNSWESYSASTYFTVIAAKYNITTSACANQSLYCFLVMNMYNELTEAQLTTNNSWQVYLETMGTHGHSKDTFISSTAGTLNISYCINATPLESLYVNGQVTYNAVNYTERTYSFLGAEFPLCLVCSISSGNLINTYTRLNSSVNVITFNVLDGGVATPGALVKIQGNFNTTDSWKTIASQVSDENGQVQFYLAYCPTYYKIIVEYEGAVVYTEKTCIKDSVVNLNIDSALAEVFDMLGLVSTTCSWLNTTEVLSCLVSDPTGRTTLATLTVTPAWTATATCTTSEASTSTTLYCDMSSAADGDYKWVLELTTAEDSYPINTGDFTIGTEEAFSADGTLLVMAFLLLLFLGARMSPVLMIIVGTVGVIMLGKLGLLHITGGFIAWLLVLAVVAIGGLM